MENISSESRRFDSVPGEQNLFGEELHFCQLFLIYSFSYIFFFFFFFWISLALLTICCKFALLVQVLIYRFCHSLLRIALNAALAQHESIRSKFTHLVSRYIPLLKGLD
jgi:hypothetical protein